MSGIYIHGMEMPQNGCATIIIMSNGTVYRTGDLKELGTAVPVPKHGDLIERKAICLTDFEIAMCDGDYKDGMKMLLEKIESAPTIIPADLAEGGE